MLYSLNKIINDIEKKEKESLNGKARLSVDLRIIHERLHEDLEYYAKTVIDILNNVNEIKFTSLKQEAQLHTTATKLQVLFQEIEKTVGR
jgi:hypothetical protein